MLLDGLLVLLDANGGVKERLVGDLRAVAFGGHEGGDGGEIPTRGVSRDRDVPGSVDRVRIRDGPLDGGVRILDRRGKGVFRSESVVDREDGATALPREVPAEPIVRLDAPEDEPAAMEEHDRGERPVRVREIEAGVEFVRGSRNRSVDGRTDTRRIPVPYPHCRPGDEAEELQPTAAVRERKSVLPFDRLPRLLVDLVGVHY